jgi:hypothetical protein
MKAPTLPLWFAVLLPIVAFAGLVVRAELLRASGPVFHVAIAGYDPRDLLQGHYLRYRLQWPADGECDGATCCLCLQTSGVHTKVACGVVDKTCDAQLSRPLVEQGRVFHSRKRRPSARASDSSRTRGYYPQRYTERTGARARVAY